ncbi:MAG: radical SAM protein [Gallionella sp.]|nr:radical SAM protein [Gallionella sp.]
MTIITIPHGVFSRLYRLSDDQTLAVVYRTHSQLLLQLEDDSAEVWQLLFDAKGNTDQALDYIRANGEFLGDPDVEARQTLNEFIEELHSNGLLGDVPPAKMCGDLTVGDAVDPQRNTTMQVAQIMADHHILYSLVLELTYRCNEKCVHCYMPDMRKGKELSLAEIENLLDQFIALGGFTIQLTGGEALLRKDFPQILKAVTRRGLLPSITTNLTLLDDRLLKAIVEAAPYSVGCSVYSARPELHDAITKVKGSCQKLWLLLPGYASTVSRSFSNHRSCVILRRTGAKSRLWLATQTARTSSTCISQRKMTVGSTHSPSGSLTQPCYTIFFHRTTTSSRSMTNPWLK